MNEDGSMARLEDLIGFARRHGLKIGTIRDLIEYRMRHDHLVERASESEFVSDYGGDWKAMTYRNAVDGSTHVALQKGSVEPGKPTLVRMHRISIFDDVLGRTGERKRTLQRAMKEIGDNGSGVVVLLMPNRPESLQNEVGGVRPADGGELREYGVGAQILADLGVHEMELLTNSHHNVVGLEGYGISVAGERPIPA